jgi:hypothetical protein
MTKPGEREYAECVLAGYVFMVFPERLPDNLFIYPCLEPGIGAIFAGTFDDNGVVRGWGAGTDPDEELKDVTSRWPFFERAASYWLQHVREA